MNKTFEKKAIEIIAKILFKIGLSRLFLVKTCGKRVILMYHNPNPKNFFEHIRFLKKNFKFVSLHGLLDGKEDGISLTFDDAYKQISDVIFPLLKKHKIPAVVFVPTGYCGKIYWIEALKEALIKTKKSRFTVKNFGRISINSADDAVNTWHALVNWMLTWNSKERDKKIVEIIKMLEVDITQVSSALVATEKTLPNMLPLIELGSHTVTHANLPTLEKKSLLEELRVSKKQVERISKQECVFFAYPFGEKKNISSAVINAVNKTGYKFALTASPSFNEQIEPYNIGRIGIGNYDSVALLCLKLSVFWPMVKRFSMAK